MQLAFYLPVIGAMRGYVFNGKWYLLAGDGESLTVVNCPQPELRREDARARLKLVEEPLAGIATCGRPRRHCTSGSNALHVHERTWKI
jgi:hypothetical protein